MFLGVDGGGTKTAFVILNKQGKILARHREASAYYLEAGLTTLKERLINGTKEVLSKASLCPQQIEQAFFGIPAFGENSKITGELNIIPSSLFNESQYTCGNDMICGWAGSLACDDGINIVSGTGSIAYGEHKKSTARCGGWGEVFSDEGSAYWIAREGINAFTKMSDGRLEKSTLYYLMRDYFSLSDDLDISAIIMEEWKASRSKISSLSVVVKNAAEKNDPIAKLIFLKAAKELSLIIYSTAKKLILIDEKIKLSYTGGVFNTGKLILDPLLEQLADLNLNFDLIVPRYHPVVGAALYAAKKNNFIFSQESLMNLKLETP